MTLVRYTYPRDVAVHGSEPIEVPAVVAHTLVVERRRAELVEPCADGEGCIGSIDGEAACDGCPNLDAGE